MIIQFKYYNSGDPSQYTAYIKLSDISSIEDLRPTYSNKMVIHTPTKVYSGQPVNITIDQVIRKFKIQ